jgi:signal peptidase I
MTDLSSGDREVRARHGGVGRSPRGPDYRMRGLDLGGDTVAVASPSGTTTDLPVGRRRRRRRLVAMWLSTLLVAGMVAFILRAYIAEPFAVRSSAMVPTLQAGDRILVLKAFTGPVTRGDMVVFRLPLGAPCVHGRTDAQEIVKRVIALPGETIWSSGDVVYVDGRRLNERGWFDPTSGPVGSAAFVTTVVPSHAYYVAGDNRADSCDSRSFGPISASSIVGKVVAIVMRGGHPHVHIF